MHIQKGDIIVSRNEGCVSRLIRMRTLSQWSHVGVVVQVIPPEIAGDKELIGIISARYSGVKYDLLKDWDIDRQFLRYKEGLSESQLKNVCSFAWRRVGRKYDFCGLLDFITFQKHQNHKRYFCSELVHDAFKATDIHLFGRRKDSAFVSPGDLYENPLFELIGEI